VIGVGLFVINHVKIAMTALERCQQNFLSKTYREVTSVSDGVIPFSFFAVFVVEAVGAAVTMGTSMDGIGKLRLAL
jgi:hypothetical protein